MHRIIRSALGATAFIAMLAAPVAAAEPAHFSDQFVTENTYSCGVTERLSVEVDGTAYFDATGSWIRDVVHFAYRTRFTDPDTGATVDTRTRQNAEFRPDTGALRGQAWFIHIPGSGVVLYDVGRLLFDTANGATLSASNKVITFDDPTADARIDAAVCSIFD